ncbi:MAG: tetratricopeptide repeat protein [Alphaproteobacteria bacterium]
MALEEACELYSKFADAFSNLGTVLRRLGDVEGAITQFEEAIRVRPDFAAAYCNLGNAYGLNDDKTAAVESYRAAIAHRGDYAEAWNNLARLLNDGDHYKEALEACLKELQSAPENPHLRNIAGNACQGLGRFSHAIEQYRYAIKKHPA